jgi:hypothetical protein
MEPEKNPFEKLYEAHISFLKWSVGIASIVITIIVSVAIGFTYSTNREYQAAMKERTTEMTLDVKNAADESKKLVANAKEEMLSKLGSVDESARNEARLAASLKVEEEFSRSNIGSLIEKVAENKLKNEYDYVLKRRMKEFYSAMDAQTIEMSDIIVAAERIGSGDRKYLTFLDSLRYKAGSLSLRQMAESTYLRKVQDYKNFYIDTNTMQDSVLLTSYSFVQGYDPKKSKIQMDTLLHGMIVSMNTSKDLNLVAINFTALSKIANKNFEMFDFATVNEWYTKEYPSAKQAMIDLYKRRKLYPRLSD